MQLGGLIKVPARDGGGMAGRDGLIVLLALVAVSVAALFSLPQGRPTAQALAIIFPPWTSGRDAMARSLEAGHRVLRGGISPFIVIIAADADAQAAPPRPRGALLMLTLQGLSGCLDAGAPEDTAR
jgi:hypothetical protein